MTKKIYIHPGLYKDLDEVLDVLNNGKNESHLEFYLKPGFYLGVRKICGNEVCSAGKHDFRLCALLGKI